MSARITAIVVVVVLTVFPGLSTAQDCPELVGRSLEGLTRDVAAAGSIAYMGNGAALTVVDLSSPAAPVVVGNLDLPYAIEAVAVDDDRVYVVTYAGLLHVIDVSTPSAPVELGSLALWGEMLSVDGDGDLVCVGTTSNLYVIDVSDPSEPTLVGTRTNATNDVDVKVVGQYAYLIDGGLYIIDLSNPANPTDLGFLGSFGGNLDVVDGLAYVASSDFRIIDVTDPMSPTQIGGLGSVGGIDVAVHGNLAFLSTDGLQVVDVSDPVAPTLTGMVANPLHEPWLGVAAIAGHGLAAAFDHGIRVIDATDPSTPAEVAAIDSPGVNRNAVYSDGVLYIAAFQRGLRGVDVSDPETSVDLAFLDLGGQVLDVAVAGDLVVAVGGPPLTVIDVSDPSSPTIVGSDPTAFGGEAVELVDGLAYVAFYSFGLRVFDLSSPASPMEIGELDLGSHMWREIVVAEGYVYLGGGDSGVEVIDVRNPANPVSVANIPTMGNGMAVNRSRLLLGDLLDLRIFDVRNPSIPVELGSYPTTNLIWVVGLSGSVAYLSVGYSGFTRVEVVDIGNPHEPTAMGQYSGVGSPTAFAFSNEMAFLSRYYSGFDTFALCQGPIFADGFETGDTTVWSSTVP